MFRQQRLISVCVGSSALGVCLGSSALSMCLGSSALNVSIYIDNSALIKWVEDEIVYV